MKETTRTHNSIRNVIFGMGSKIIILLLEFISRTIFIKVLGEEYLGVNGLYTNVLMVLSLAELGIGNAILYSMYKPMAEKDEKKLAALMNYYRMIYNRIAVIVAIVGVAIIPFLKYIINSNLDTEHLILYYVLFLTNSVVSYLLANRSTIINVDQKNYLINAYTTIGTIAKTIGQIIILYATHNYALYLVIQILYTFFLNLFNAYKAKKMYPYITHREEKLEEVEKKKIFENIKSIFMYKFGGVIMNNTTNILISSMIGTVWVGYYSNYSMIINAITTVTTIIFSSVMTSVGNLNVKADSEKQYTVFNRMTFFSNWLFTILSIGLVLLFNEFITLWIGNKYILDNQTVLVIVMSFYIIGVFNPVWMFRDTVGMFKKTKYVYMITAFLNLIFAVILGKVYGLFGILLAGIVARLLTNMWYEPTILYKDYFHKNPAVYFWKYAQNVVTLFIAGGTSYFVLNFIPTGTIGWFGLRGVAVVFVTNLVLWIVYRKTGEYHYFYENFIKKVIKNRSMKPKKCNSRQ